MSEKTTQATICQLTTGHALNDERILHRMAWTAKRAGYQSCVAGPAETDSEYQGIRLIKVYKPSSNRWLGSRIFAWIRLTFWALRSDIRLFQIHDPDLIPGGLVLRMFGRKVIYDVHDDYQGSLEGRLKSKPVLRPWFPKLWWWFEKAAARCFSGVIVADSHLAKKFSTCNPVILGNYPRLDFTSPANLVNSPTFNLLYVGGVTRDRGIGIVLDALRKLNFPEFRLHIVGNCRDELLKQELTAEHRVVMHGQVEWTQLREHYQNAHLGLAIYQPLPGFVTVDHSVKIIEYMAAGIPIITSDFPGLRRFVQDNGFGIVVDPQNAEQLAKEIDNIYQNPELAKRLGDRGRKLFETEYFWEKHEAKLAALYDKIAPPKVQDDHK